MMFTRRTCIALSALAATVALGSAHAQPVNKSRATLATSSTTRRS